jgi:hypothetical protein
VVVKHPGASKGESIISLVGTGMMADHVENISPHLINDLFETRQKFYSPPYLVCLYYELLLLNIKR